MPLHIWKRGSHSWVCIIKHRCRGINEHGGYFGVSARDCKIRGSKSAAGNPMATPGALLGAPELAH